MEIKSMRDLPAFINSGKINTDEGFRTLTSFLTKDSSKVRENGGVVDGTGHDGITEIIAEQGTDEFLEQRARSAATIWWREKGMTDCTP
jgi:hypothetical protein